MKSRKIAFSFFAGFTLIVIGYFLFCVCYVMPDSYTLIEGSSLNFRLPPGITASYDMPASVGGRLNEGVTEKTESRIVSVKVLGIIPAGKVSVNTVKAPLLYPSGECIGVKMYSDGLIVSGFTDFETSDGICVSPGANAGLKSGDVITKINGTHTSSVKEFTKICDKSGDSCTLTVSRDGKTYTVRVIPSMCIDGHKRMGIYVKNSIAGVGTMTYIMGDRFGALGHAVTDSGTLVPLKSGNIYKADIIDVAKGQKGIPGELIGAISEDMYIGKCTQNTYEGVYGSIENTPRNATPVEAMPSSEIQIGKATILCAVKTDDKVGEYNAEIVSINRLSKNKTKSFSIRITDEELIKRTGGIVQGMSGSPIIQNGKLVGAVTHVFVNDPTRGYGIFIENMLAEAEKIK